MNDLFGLFCANYVYVQVIPEAAISHLLKNNKKVINLKRSAQQPRVRGVKVRHRHKHL